MIKRTITVSISRELASDPTFESRPFLVEQARKKGITGRIVKAVPVRRSEDYLSGGWIYSVELDIERVHGKPYARAVRKYRRPAHARGYV